MKHTKTTAKVLAVAFAASLAFACDELDSLTGPEEPGAGRVLSVSLARQQTDVWCWAAVSEMVLRYYGQQVAQCQILSGWYRGDCCAFPGLCRTTAPIAVIQETLFAFGVGSSYLPRALTFEELAFELDAGRPIIIAYRGSFAGHVVVLYGYDPDGFVYIHDPFFGTFRRVSYGNSFSYNGQLFWSETLYGIG